MDAVMFYFGTTISETLSARLTWDGENRLTGWAPRVPQSGSKKLDFRYDYRNRRVEKKVSTYSGTAWAVSDVRRFIWSDWLLLAELRGDPNDPNEPNKFRVERYHTWGLDLAGLSGSVNSLHSAGGIGGLLACHDPNDPNDPNDLYGDFLYFFDGNGNVGQLVDSVGSPTAAPTLAAKYEYDPYGNTMRAPADPNSGPYGAANPMRFSTKPWDDETGLGNWGLRYYNGTRWLSRDPLGEPGGIGLYCYASNNPVDAIDVLGLKPSVRWFVDIHKSVSNPISLDAVIRVTITDKPCCACDRVLWLQLVEEVNVGRVFAGGTDGWAVDNMDPPRPLNLVGPYHDVVPWYTKDVVEVKPFTTPSGCTIGGELRDSPGAGSSPSWWTAFNQEFESCAVCVRSEDGCGARSCVLGCVRWGHTYHRDKGHIFQPPRYPLAPSENLLDVLKQYNRHVPRGPKNEVDQRLGGPWTNIDAHCGF